MDLIGPMQEWSYLNVTTELCIFPLSADSPALDSLLTMIAHSVVQSSTRTLLTVLFCL